MVYGLILMLVSLALTLGCWISKNALKIDSRQNILSSHKSSNLTNQIFIESNLKYLSPAKAGMFTGLFG
jgi:hypothetical protein